MCVYEDSIIVSDSYSRNEAHRWGDRIVQDVPDIV